MILIVGGNGNMGRRYQAILKHLEQPFAIQEKAWGEFTDEGIHRKVTGIILATPTDSHLHDIEHYLRFKKPILCEKPLSKDIPRLKEIALEAKKSQVALQMMLQYETLLPAEWEKDGHSLYNYFKHGSDGLYWDCIQIIGLAKKSISLKEESPIWDCVINGYNIPIESMDFAYLQFIRRWLSAQHHQNLNRIIEMHEKTKEMADAH